ncbi:MAG: hypothetical protein WC495_01405 [Patescibacteria group bacterium]|jgi:predicted MFS family arabinose efflux permease
MGTKSIIYLGMFIGSFVGGWVPTLWGANPLGLESVLGGLIGGFLGIWGGFKLSKAIGG